MGQDTSEAPGVPPDVAARIVRAIDRSPSTVVVLLDVDLRMQWISQSAVWATGSDPAARRGSSVLQRIHPDDVERLLHGLEVLRDADGADPFPRAPQIRYRFQHFDESWIEMEATVHNLLDDPEVEGLLVFARPLDAEVDGVGQVIDMLMDEAPLPDLLAACAALVPDLLGAAAVVALLDDGPVVGVPAGSPAARLADDQRWWQAAVRCGPLWPQGRSLWPTDFNGFPDDLADRARAEGFQTAWATPIHEPSSGDVIGCLVVWVRTAVERNIATDDALRHTERLARLVITDRHRRAAPARRAPSEPTPVRHRRFRRRRR